MIEVEFEANMKIIPFWAKEGKAIRGESLLNTEATRKEVQNQKINKNPMKTVKNAAKSFGTRLSPKVERKPKKIKERVALLKVN